MIEKEEVDRLVNEKYWGDFTIFSIIAKSFLSCRLDLIERLEKAVASGEEIAITGALRKLRVASELFPLGQSSAMIANVEKTVAEHAAIDLESELRLISQEISSLASLLEWILESRGQGQR